MEVLFLSVARRGERRIGFEEFGSVLTKIALEIYKEDDFTLRKYTPMEALMLLLSEYILLESNELAKMIERGPAYSITPIKN